MTPVRHLFTHFASLGGVQSILRQHVTQDPARDIDSRFVAFFEPPTHASRKPDSGAADGLSWTWRTSIRSARHSLRSIAWRPNETAVYHNCWGLPFLASADTSHRRIGVLHSDWPGMDATLRAQRGLLDGLLCVSHPLVRQATDQLPELEAGRIQWIPYPVHPPESPVARPDPSPATPLRIGFIGRLERHQKRVERLPEAVHQWRQSGLSFQFEILGDGPERAFLQSAFRNADDVRVLGRRTGDGYWSVLTNWDVLVFVSDFEGLPISMLEALSQGVIPVHPAIGTGGDEYASQIDPALVYRPGDLADLSRALLHLRSHTTQAWTDLRLRARDLARPHLGAGYFNVFSSFLTEILRAPRISRAASGPRPAVWSDFVPFGFLRRLFPSGLLRPDSPPSRNPPGAKAHPTDGRL